MVAASRRRRIRTKNTARRRRNPLLESTKYFTELEADRTISTGKSGKFAARGESSGIPARMARPAGLEPATPPRLRGRCPFQVNYSPA
jgi:hypothetical protein